MFSFIIYNDKNITSINFDLFAKVILKNFIHLEKYVELEHNIETIKETLYKNTRLIILCIVDNKLVGYIVGYYIKLNDGRNVLYISYLYVAKHMRKNGLGTLMLNIAKNEANKKNIDGIMLTCDTEDIKIMNFYESKGYFKDFQLRRYSKYDVMYLQL